MGGEIVKIKFSTLLFYAFSFFSSVKYVVDLDYYQRNAICLKKKKIKRMPLKKKRLRSKE
jgi:hypothetical protein